MYRRQEESTSYLTFVLASDVLLRLQASVEDCVRISDGRQSLINVQPAPGCDEFALLCKIVALWAVPADLEVSDCVSGLKKQNHFPVATGFLSLASAIDRGRTEDGNWKSAD